MKKNKTTKVKLTARTLGIQIEKQKAKIAEERDKLRALLEDAESVAETCDRCIECLDDAVSSLSELV